MQTEVVAGLDGLSSLERECFERSDTEPSVSYEWTQALARTQLGAHDRTYVIVVRRAGRLAAVVPLYARGTLVFGQWQGASLPDSTDGHTIRRAAKSWSTRTRVANVRPTRSVGR